MHQKLTKAPVTYVLAQVKFSTIENMANYAPQLQDKIRDLFPHYETFNIQTLQLREGQQPNIAMLTQWHFIDKEKHMGIILDKQSIIVHASKHEDFHLLLNIFEKVISRFNEALSISLSTRLGVRYINIIDSGLTNVSVGLQGFQLSSNEFKEKKFLTKTETTQLSKYGVIKIQSTHISNKELIGNVQNIFVPPDLTDTAKLLSFKHFSEPKQNFIVLDIDHFNESQNDFAVSNIMNHLNRLQEGVHQAFCQAVGNENIKSWM